jgi:hypothetical protein
LEAIFWLIHPTKLATRVKMPGEFALAQPKPPEKQTNQSIKYKTDIFEN